MEKLSDLLKKEVKRVCKDGGLEVSNFVNEQMIPDFLKVILPSSFNIRSKELKLEKNTETSPELNLRVEEFKKLINKIQNSQTKCDTKKLRQVFLEEQKAKSLSVVEDQVLTAAYSEKDSARASSPVSSKAKITGVVLRRSPKYVSIISLGGSKEFLVEIGEPFHLLEVKIKVGDVLSVIVNPQLKKTKDLNPELLCCYDISKDEVDAFVKNLKLLMNNPFGILEEFGRSLAVWQHILDVSITKEEDEKQQGVISKNILEICKIFSDLQAKTQMTTTMKSFWNALEDSKFFNEVLPEIIKDEAWQWDNVHLVQIFLENLLKVHPECAVRLAPGILESLIRIPESGAEFSQKLFSIIAPCVTGVSEKPKHLKWNQRSVIPLPTELQHDPKYDYKDLQPVRVRKDEDEDEEEKKMESAKKNEMAYKSEEEYIKTYYTLLREECFHKAKKGIQSFLVKGECDPKDNMLYSVKLIGISDLNQLSIQEGLSLVLELCHNSSKTSETENTDPDNSKWLMLGNLVCLSLDATFKNPVWGITSKERTAEDSKKKHVHVSLCTTNNRLKDSEVITQLQDLKSQGLLSYMIESNTFYPAYGPPLEVLKKKVTVPFAEQLVKVKKSPSQQESPPDCSVAQHDSLIQWMFAKLPNWIQSYWYQEDKTCQDQLPQQSGPGYLRHITKPPKWDVIFEKQPSSESSVSSGFYDVVREFKNMREDPESKPKLDDKQLDAVEQALFNKVALIQGPPGTGKSFVGKALLHLLLSMEVPKHGPILIVTYKNHSLDEFLESFLDKNPEFKKGVVRVGKSKEDSSELLRQCNLSQLASGTMEKKMYQNFKRLETELYLIKKEIDKCFRELEDSNLFTASVFLKEANEKHLKSLVENKKEKLEKLNKMMKDKNFWDKHWKELLEMIKGPLQTWLPSTEEFKSFADKAGMTQANQSNAGYPSSSVKSNNQSDSNTEETNDDDCVGLETQPSDDLEERQGALLDQQDKMQVGVQIDQSAVPTSPCKEVLITLPVIPDEKLGNFKSILNAGDIKKLTLEEKIQFVYALQRQNRKSLSEKFSQLTEELSQKQQIKKEIRNQHYVNLLKKCKVIFMTVSGAAIRSSWLESIKPSVMIVEEAAEILESQLVAVIPSSVQHLVMIGDHRQLRPQVHCEVLCRKCNFHISMFERLIKGGLDYAQLNKQGRMRDEIAELVRRLGIYEEYETRQEVVQGNHFPNCLTKPMYFLDHKCEVKPHPLSHSKYNSGEANLIIRVAKFLLKKGVPPNKVTILCSYRGQVNEFKKRLSKDDHGLSTIKITTIDSFQGKENDIILLSLVSNIRKSQKSSEARIGYLKCENRLCVAISRARCGLYLFGNADLLSNESRKYWKKIIDFMREKKCLGKELSQFLNQEATLQCIKETSIGEAPNTTPFVRDLKILIEPEKPLQDGFALLAEQFGLNRDDIHYLKSKINAEPTEDLLRQFSSCTIGELQGKINSIEDLDVRIAELVKNYILQNCECIECAFT